MLLRRGPGAARRAPPEQPSATHPAARTRTSLAAVPLFRRLLEKHLNRLAKQTDELTFDPGERIVEEGMLGETLFVVLRARPR